MTKEIDDFMTSVTLNCGDSLAYQIEQRVKLVVNDKPKRMSQKTWENMCRKVLTIQMFPLITKRAE